MILVVEVETDSESDLSDAALLSRKERVIRTIVQSMRRGIAAILNVKEKEIGIVGFESAFGEALPKPDRHLGATEN